VSTFDSGYIFATTDGRKSKIGENTCGLVELEERAIYHHLSTVDCLGDKSEDYQNCSVLYCVLQLCTVIGTSST